MGTHQSLEEPPNVPFFQNKCSEAGKKSNDRILESVSSTVAAVMTVMKTVDQQRSDPVR